MNFTRTRRNAAASLVALLLASSPLSAFQESSAQQESLEANGFGTPTIEGSWIFNIERINQGFSFTALQSFTAGGVTLATGSGDRNPPPPISPLYGSWERVEPNGFAATIFFFAFDLDGNAVAMIKTNLRLHLKGKNALVAQGQAYSCDVQGENCVRVPAVDIQIAGKRIKPEKLQD